MNDSFQIGLGIRELAREAVAHANLTRPDWTANVRRNPDLLWLDRNENRDPGLSAVIARIVAEVLSGTGSRWLSTYPDSAQLYDKLAAHIGCRSRNLLLAAGSDGVIRSAFEAFVNSGDVVLHTFPTFAMYPVYSKMYGARVELLRYQRHEVGPILRAEQIIEAIIAARPKLVCLPNPDSPTGTVIAPNALRAIVEACARSSSVILIDEAYYPFYSATAAAWTASIPNLIVARTFAKAWGLAGLRVGYAIAHEDTAALLHKVRPMYEVNTVAVAVMERMLDFAQEMEASVMRLIAGRDGFMDAMEALGLRSVRTNANFSHVAFGSFETSVAKALEPMVLYRRDGGDDCLRGYSRFSATTPELFAPIIDRISRVVSTPASER